tara:strand:- start:861 stop:1460 length:600 start_codon:yes stop_codon:yes gene_type:complete
MQLVLPDARDLQRREQWLVAQRARQLPFAQYMRSHGFRGARVGVDGGADVEVAPLLPAGHADSDGGAAKRRALHRSQLYLPVSWLSGGLLCLGVVVVILVVGFVLLFISGLWQAQTAVAMAKDELMPHLDRLLNATDLIVADAQASLSHVHLATETGSAVASNSAAAIVALLNASAGAAQHTEVLLRHPTLRISLGDGV